MKNSKFTKLIAIVASVVLLIGATVAIAVMADSAEPAPVLKTDKLGVVGINASYDAQTRMAFAVENKLDAVAEGVTRDIYLLFFNADPDANGEKDGYTLYKNAVARSSQADVMKNGNLIFYSNGIMAKDIANDMFVCPIVVEKSADSATYTRGFTKRVADDNSAVTYTYEARACNLLTYARQKVIETTTAINKETDEVKMTKLYGQLSLFSNIIAYSKAVSNKGGATDTLTSTLTIEGGVIIGSNADGAGYFETTVTGYSSDTVTVRAEAKNADGEYFLYWQDIFGKVVSTKRIYSAPVHNSIGITKYTAVYGAKNDSYYAATVDFESTSNEALDADMFYDPANIGSYTSANDSQAGATYLKANDVEINGVKENYDTAYIGDLMLQNRYYIDATTKEAIYSNVLKIVSNNGDNSLHMAKDSKYFMNLQKLKNTNENANAIEFDMQFSTDLVTTDNVLKVAFTANSYKITFVIGVTGNAANGYEVRVGFLNGTKVAYGTADNATAVPSTSASSAVVYKLSSLDEVFTFKAVVDDSGSAPIARAYINGNAMFCGAGTKISTFANGYFSSIKNFVSGTAKITETSLQLDRAFDGGVTIDNLIMIEE